MRRLICFITLILLATFCVACEQNQDYPSQSTSTTTKPTNLPPEEVVIEKIQINELMANNDRFVLRCFDDWVELYNGEDKDVNLNGYYLVAGEKNKNWIDLTGKTIEADGYLIIKLDEFAKFRLSKEGETIKLIKGATLVDSLTYDSTIGKGSWSHEGLCVHPTPGFANSDVGYQQYLDSIQLPDLYISEVMSSNSKYAPVDGKCYDFIELYNNSSRVINLAEYYLSDKKDELMLYQLPNENINPGAYKIIYCSGLEQTSHAPFKISAEGESVYLVHINECIDYVRVPSDLQKNHSYGRVNNRFVYMVDVTPGAENKPGTENSLTPPMASIPSGAYFEPLTIELNGEGTIYYTLDGTSPTRSSLVYKNPIVMNSSGCIRCFADWGEHTSELTSYSYLIDIEHIYPVIMISIPEDSLTGETGVLNHVTPEYEHEAYVSMINQGEIMFTAPCGFKLHGNDSKKGAKQNFQLRFRAKYGMGKLHYKVFDNLDIEVFNSFLLKGGSEDFQFCGMRDEFCTNLVNGTTNLFVSEFRPVILYLNDQYWGLYFLHERYDAEYVAQHLGVAKESVNLLHTYGSLQAGSLKSWNALISFCEKNDLRIQENYDHVMNQIDAYSLMDWYICRSYMGDRDLANMRFFQSTEGDGKWHWAYFDLDWAFWTNYTDSVESVIKNDGHHVLIQSLLKNPEFKDMFLKRYAELMKTFLNEETILARVDYFEAMMRPEMPQNQERYGLTMQKWESHLERLRNIVRNGAREPNVLGSIQKFFKLSDEQMIYYFGRVK